MEFNLENIEAGAFNKSRGGKKSDWIFVASLRLAKEAGYTFTKEAEEKIVATPLKWYYWFKQSEPKGNIIIGFHRKDTKMWLYVVYNNKAEVQGQYKTIQEAKESFTTTK